jgi:thymidylate synthase
MPEFECESADGAWLLAVAALKKKASEPLQEGRGGKTVEVLHATIHVSDCRQRWVVSRHSGLSVAFAIVEAIGILNGRRDSGYLNFFNPRLPKFAGEGPVYHGAYGFRLRHHLGFDQLERASESLRNNPDGRQAVLQIWYSTTDFPKATGEPVAPDVPCNICSMLKVRDGRLEWSQIMRSNDVWKGLPYNFVQFTTLQEVIAGWIGVEPGAYTHFSDSLHVYEEDADAAFSSAEIAVGRNTDSLALPKSLADPLWAEMNRRVDLLSENRVSAGEFASMARIADAPQAFTNLLSVVVADAARRRGHFDIAEQAISACDNVVLQHLWSSWCKAKKMPQPSLRANSESAKTA